MSIRLISLEILPKGNAGWSTEKLSFGDGFTLIRGANGSGKTPLMQSVAYCFGYPSKFRKGMYENCKSVKLELSSNGKTYLVERECQEKGLQAKVSNVATGEVTTFSNESEISAWFFGLNAIAIVKLTNSDDKNHASVYTSTYLPTFFIDQDEGWQNPYKAPHSFIKDQREEMLRLTLGLSARHPFHVKDALISERKNLELLEEQVSDRRTLLKELKKALSTSDETDIASLQNRKKRITQTLSELRGGLAGLGQATALYDSEISDTMRAISRTEDGIHTFTVRSSGVKTIKAEIESEIEALSLNVEAAEAFREFCDQPDCQVFCSTGVSYGKSLLYLKDQIKDLETNISRFAAQFDDLQESLVIQKEKLISLKNSRHAALTEQGFGDLVTLIETNSKQFVEIETRLSFAAKLDDLQAQLNTLFERREVSKVRVDELLSESKNRSGTKTSAVKTTLGEKVKKWMGVLNTKNSEGQPSFDDKFKLQIGTESIKAFSGSTKTRLVLAYHAAVLETSLESGGNHPGVLLMDTPKQHDLKVEDLRDYYNELKSLSKKYPNRVQIVIAFVDADIEPQAEDKIWLPTKDSPDGKRYLGSPLSV